MTYRRILTALLVLAAVPVVSGLLWQRISAQEAPSGDDAGVPQKELATTETLGGEDRYLTYLSTDKPIYRIGETVYMRGVLLHHATRQPMPVEQNVASIVEIRGPKGDVVASGQVASEASALGFRWTVPDEQAGGQYTIKATYPYSGHPPAERKFDVRAYRAPRLKTQIKFVRDGYGPGDQVAAILNVQRAEGGVPAGAPVTVTARVDGAEVFRGSSSVDSRGDCVTRFQLPAQIARGEGTLAMAIEDGGVVETASKTIPILLQTVDLTLYPEGGDLVARLPSRVYFEAFTPAHKPADLAGVVVDQDGAEVAEFRSEHEGRGRFEFVPRAGREYSLKILEPSGIDTLYSLPKVKLNGVALQANQDTFGSDEPVSLSVGSAPRPGKLRVTLAKREKVIAEQIVKASQQETGNLTQVDFALTADDPDGILIATVWDEQGMPRAERLVFRRPAKSVNVQITADAPQYVPGGRVQVTLRTNDEDGSPVDAVVGITVTDDSVLEMIERREQAPRLPVMVLLEGDVRELADAHVYLDPENSQAPAAVDLLLATQGWRRFAFVRTESLLRENGDIARRALALRMPSPAEVRSRLAQSSFKGAFEFDGEVDDAFGMQAEGLEVDRSEKAGRVDRLGAAMGAAAPAGMGGPEPPAGPMPVDREMQKEEMAEGEEEARDAPALAIPEQASIERKRLANALQEADESLPALDLFGDIAAEMPMRPAVRADFVPVRLYAHQTRSDRRPGERVDFTETLFWHAGIATGKEGVVSIEFGLNDSVSSFRVLADVFTADGAVGSSSAQIDSVEPFYLEPKLPLEVTMDDVIRAPIGIVNATGVRLGGTSIHITARAEQEFQSAVTPFDMEPGDRLRRMMRIKVGQFTGQAEFELAATAGPYGDRVTRTVAVRPLGFPVEDGVGGLIRPADTVSHPFVIPDDLVRGSLSTRIVVHPTPLASMTEALERLIREPCGCFEQTSSTTYPLVMAQQYFLSHEGVDPSLIEHSSGILETSYNRLIGFESPSGGYEWFGGDPGHDALTAYGLLEFTDMAQVRHVDSAMLQRTRDWLLAQRDGRGGYARKTHTLHTWLADPEVAYTYDTWALLEARVDGDLSAEVAWVRDAAERAQNTYVIALAANVLALAGDEEGLAHMLDELAGTQGSDGALSGATVSVVGSTGEALAIETTALAVLAWLRSPHYVENVERSIKFLAESCKAGRYGSTQSTVLALRAIVAYDQSRAAPKAPGSLQLIVDGTSVGESVSFSADTHGVIELPDISDSLTPGEHQVQIRMTDGSPMPYSATVDYHRTQPDSSDECKVHLEVQLRDREVEEGNVTEASVVVVNRVGETIPMPVAIIGVPGGLEVRHDQLKELVKEGKIAAYEVLGREIVLYWRALQAEERVELPISLVAAVPGKYTGPASRAYMYYTDEHKHWVSGLQAMIHPKRADTESDR